MFIYLLIIILCFILSFIKKEKVINIFFFLGLYIFLCYGYMCGSDWRNYELEYYNSFNTRLVEPGYMFLSNFFLSLGVSFWPFHILIKSLCFFSYLYFFFRYNYTSGLYFIWMLFLASFGFFLFIDCPFRNLIAMSIMLWGFVSLSKNRYILFYLFTFLACTFHLSSILLFVIPIIKFNKIPSSWLYVIYFSVLCLLFFHIDTYFISLITSPFPSLYNRLFEYEDTKLFQGNILSIGLILRLICLFLMIRYRYWIRDTYDSNGFVFNMCFWYLLFSLVSYSIPILFRLPFFLSPFYVVMVFYICQRFSHNNKIVIKMFYFVVAFIITLKTITDKPYYIPYTNIIPCVLTDERLDYNYRSNYNFQNSPYK